jgi:hypothetical protein
VASDHAPVFWVVHVQVSEDMLLPSSGRTLCSFWLRYLDRVGQSGHVTWDRGTEGRRTRTNRRAKQQSGLSGVRTCLITGNVPLSLESAVFPSFPCPTSLRPLNLRIPVATKFTLCFNVSSTEFCSQSVSVCSVLFSQQTVTVSANRINRLGSVAEKQCVSCEVWTAHRVYLCVPSCSHNKERLFPQTALTGWAL